MECQTVPTASCKKLEKEGAGQEEKDLFFHFKVWVTHQSVRVRTTKSANLDSSKSISVGTGRRLQHQLLLSVGKKSGGKDRVLQLRTKIGQN